MNTNLNKARVAKNDEFYTKLSTIEDELKWYDLKGKVVYCNCDDYRWSNFYRYFKDNFSSLGIKGVVASNKDIGEGAFLVEFDGVKETISPLVDGGFDSEECREVLTRCDVVITNPPFSLFSGFVSMLITFNKNFIVLGNLNAVTYKEVFPLVMSGEVGFGTKQGAITYNTPEGEKKLGNKMWDNL